MSPKYSTGRRPVRRVGLVATMAVVSSLVGFVASGRVGAVGTSGNVTGTVFQDFNSDGEFDTTETSGEAKDVGVAGVEVRAFDSSGAQVGSTTSASTGTYTLAVTAAATNQVRLEFTIPPSGPLVGFAPSFGVGGTGASSSTSGTSVQFATIGDTGVNFGVNHPEDFCQNNPNIAVSRQCAGDTSAVDSAPTVWVSHFDGGPFLDSTTRFSNWTSTRAANASQTGSVQGMAWNPVSRRVIHSAYVRRSVKMYENPVGTPLPGALFSTVPSATDSSGSGGTTSFLVNLEALMPGDQFSKTAAPPSGVANAGFTGFIPSNAARGIGTDSGTDSDIPAGNDGVFEEVGKTGIGDIDIDADGNLFVVSLYTAELYEVPMPDDGSAPTSMTSMGSIVSDVFCTNGDPRPFGITIKRGIAYMGVVCDGSADYSSSAPTSTSDDRHLTFSIVSFDTIADSWGTVFGPTNLYAAVSGDPTKGYVFDPTIDTSAPPDQDQWNPWTDKFDAQVYYHPTPMLSDIEIDSDGSFILGFRDRWADQWGHDYGSDPRGDASSIMMMGGGDIKRICKTATGYVFEGGTGCAFKGTNGTGTLGTSQTSDDEWYFGEKFVDNHYETVTGMTEFVPGSVEVLVGTFDPWEEANSNYVDSAGVIWLNNSTGAQAGPHGKGVMFYDTVYQPDGMFGKANGVADIEALCDAAPVQVGNRVWMDSDRDGIQDAGEPGLAGVTARLYDAGGSLAGTAVTNSDGEYQFSSTNSEAATGGSTPDFDGGGLEVGAVFTVKLDNPADYSTGTLAGLAPTTLGATTTASTDAEDEIDNDGAVVSGSTFGVDSFPQATITAHDPGANDHSFDFGMVPSVSVTGVAWCDVNDNGTKDAGEDATPGLSFSLVGQGGGSVTTVSGTSVGAATSGSDGSFRFDRLPTGSYEVTVTVPNRYTLAASSTASVVTGALSAAGDTASTRFAICSPGVDVGDFVWKDLNKNGIQDRGEPGLAGVVLSITKPDGTPVEKARTRSVGAKAVVPSTTSDANGHYEFKGVRPGLYMVTVTPPAGLIPTKSGVGSAEVDSSDSPALWRDLADGDADNSLDFGFVDAPRQKTKPVSIGDFVWRDRNGDGFQARHEKGFAGATLRLYDSDGKPARTQSGALVKAQVTGKDGRYLFTNLWAGRYTVRITYPRGFRATTSGFPNVHKDSSRNIARSVDLSPGSVDKSLDFGVVGDWKGLANTR